jgi:cytochrome c oxidase cbb3-type subunit 3
MRDLAAGFIFALSACVAGGAAQGADTLSPAGEGRRVFLEYNCYGCHGDGATGGMGPNIVGAGSGIISFMVNFGNGLGMPSFKSYLNATDVDNLAAYLASIGGPDEPKWHDWWVANPTQ